MKSIRKPNRAARAVFEECVNALSIAGVRDRLKPLATAVESAEATYLAMAATTTLYGISGGATFKGDRTADMVSLYKNVLSRKTSKVRHIYDEIKASAKGGICPLCEHNVVKTLDHYLEKQKFPIYAVAPINLVPACTDCNKVRSQREPLSASDQTLHPYFDSTSDYSWLHAEVLPIDPVAIQFTALRPPGWDILKQDRLQSHFRVLGLAELYTVLAAGELAQIRAALINLSNVAGRSGLEAHLAEQAKSRQTVSLNSWQTALYVALSESVWFCGGGYTQIAAP